MVLWELVTHEMPVRGRLRWVVGAPYVFLLCDSTLTLLEGKVGKQVLGPAAWRGSTCWTLALNCPGYCVLCTCFLKSFSECCALCCGREVRVPEECPQEVADTIEACMRVRRYCLGAAIDLECVCGLLMP